MRMRAPFFEEAHPMELSIAKKRVRCFRIATKVVQHFESAKKNSGKLRKIVSGKVNNTSLEIN